MADFETDKANSIQDSKRYIYPVLRSMYGNAAEILSIEEIKNTLAQRLDNAGIDIIVIVDDVIIGINSRCHKWSNYQKTFTIRKDRHGKISEYDRIKKNMERGGLTPKYFAQVYSKNDDYAEVIIVPTTDLFGFVGENINDTKKVAKHKNKDVEFLSVNMKLLKNVDVYKVSGKNIEKLK